MKTRRLGNSAIAVSDICMGTMTFGNQADEKTSMRIMDMAFDAGIDFYDTAENYPVPPDPSYAGETERIEQVLSQFFRTFDIVTHPGSGPLLAGKHDQDASALDRLASFLEEAFELE